MLLDGNSVNIGIAFLAGVASFFAPCVAPVVPGYIGFLAGGGVGKEKRPLIVPVLTFCIGFVLIFVLLGLGASHIGSLLAQYKMVLSRVGGVVMILLGLVMLNAIPIRGLYTQRKLKLSLSHRGRVLSAFGLGLTFGLAWSPCIGPVLGVILLWASQSETALAGATLLLVYGLGLATPFLLVGIFLERALKWLAKTRKMQRAIHLISAITVIIFGLLLATNTLSYIVGPLVHLGSLELLLIN